MASLKSSVIGIPSGKMGGVIVRIRNGKPFYYSLPLNFKMSMSAAAVEGRNNFASAQSLAKIVNASPKLREIWTNAKIPGTNSYQRLIKNNRKLAVGGSLTTSNMITPPGLPLKINSALVENKKLILSFDCPAVPDLSFPAVLFTYIYFGGNSRTIIPFKREIAEPAPDGRYYIETSLDSNTKRLLSNNPSPIIYLALAGGTANKKKVYWTTTASAKL